MKVVLDIPKEFEDHYNKERFQDSLKRINYDIRSIRYEGLSGTYEYEVIEMLIKAFKESWEIRFNYISEGIDNALKFLKVEKELLKAYQEGETYDRSQSSNIGDKES